MPDALASTPDPILAIICTPDYVGRALAVQLSLRETGRAYSLELLTTESVSYRLPATTFTSLDELCEHDDRAVTVRQKYWHRPDAVRWALKPVFLSQLLRKHPDRAILLCDTDLCFFRPPDGILAHLRDFGLVLTPHWRPHDPAGLTREFRLNFMDGLFNAGCMAANARGLKAVDWWARACIAACERNYGEGLFDDQRYLDLMLVHFPEVAIYRDPGFNLAFWNHHLRLPGPDGTRIVPDRWPVSMVHFTKDTVAVIEGGEDPVLVPFMVRYLEIGARAAQLFEARDERE
jgi:hypothetical protein